MSNRKLRGFTLVELLVVIGVIVVLIGILLPALIGSRRRAQGVVCAANLRSLGQSLAIYTVQSRYYPGAFSYQSTPDLPRTSSTISIWQTRLRVSLGGNSEANRRVFHCPARDDSFAWSIERPAWWPRATARETGFGYELDEPLLLMDLGGWPPAGGRPPLHALFLRVQRGRRQGDVARPHQRGAEPGPGQLRRVQREHPPAAS